MDSLISRVPSPVAGSSAGYFEKFGVTMAVIRQVLARALSRGAQDADLFFEHSVANTVGLSDGKVNKASTAVDLGMGVRAVIGDQVGYAYTEILTIEAMLSAAETAAAIADGPSTAAVADMTPRRFADLYHMTRPWDSVGMQERVSRVKHWEEQAFASDKRITKVQCLVADSERIILVARPDGRLVQDHQPMALASVNTTAEEGGRRESAGYNVAARAGLELLTPELERRLVEQAVERTVFLLDAEPPPAGEMPVVLGQGPSGILLHEAIGHGMEADFARKGISIYADKVGRKVAGREVTVVDDGTIPQARGAINVDDEGNPPQRTVLVKDGVLQGFLHDEISARHYSVPPTGSGRREGFRSPPIPRMRATFMEPGPHEPADIIRSVKRGIYCGSFGNGQVQIGAGDFAFYMRHGWLIEDGKLTRPIKDANVIGNGPEALARVSMVGNDLLLDEGGWTCGKDGQGVPVTQGIPTVLVSSLVVGGVG